MPIRNDHTPWSDAEKRRLSQLSSQGVKSDAVASTLNHEFHGGQPIRNLTAVRLQRGKMGVYVAKNPATLAPKIAPPQSEQEVETRNTTDSTEARAVGVRIKTVDDLLRHIKADMTRFEIERSEATKYEVATKDPETGKVTTTELHRVFVRLKPKAGPSVLDTVEAMIAGAVGPRKPVVVKREKGRNLDVLQALVIADPHIGKHAWGKETGWQDYDIKIARDLLKNAAGELLEDGDHRKVGKRLIVLLGDYFHYDTPDAKTTKGTPLERDGRVEKMVEEGAAILFDIIEQSAAGVQTEVVLVPGNHDAMMTVALRHILRAYFRNDNRVTLDDLKTTRKYYTHGKVLLGMTHGDKAKKRLGELMPSEVPNLWGDSLYREWHTGHLHGEAEVQTVGGVVIRTAPALCPPDGWHAQEGYVGKPRGMQAFYYHAKGSLLGMSVSNPDRAV
jgi:metallophosphoesterase superfamily enzyme